MTARAHIGLETKLAAALLTLGDIDYEHSKLMSARQICSLYQFDHYPIRKDDDGPDEPWNLVPRMIIPHREKTAKIDVPQMAKADRLALRAAQIQRDGHSAPKIKASRLIPARVNPWSSGRKLPSRPFEKRGRG